MMENDKHNKTGKIIGWVMSVFLSVIGSAAVCGFIHFIGALASISFNWTYGIIFLIIFIVLMKFFLSIANGTHEDDEDDDYYCPYS